MNFLKEIRVKLPKLELSKFDADITKWQWDQSIASINTYKSDSDIKKFNYLRAFLTDSTFGTISELSLSLENYKEAIKLLQDRYGNKKTLIFTYMDNFVQLPVVSELNDIAGLRTLYDKIEIIIRNLIPLIMQNCLKI